MEDLGHRPQGCAHAMPEPVVQEILKLRFQHPTWDARKLRARLEQTRGDTDWPAASTINSILRHAGLVHTRKRRITPCTSPLGAITAPNQVFSIPEPTYEDSFAVRRVRNVGHIKWQGSLIFLSEMLCHELVGLLPIEEDRYQVYFGPVLLGELDMELRTFIRVR